MEAAITKKDCIIMAYRDHCIFLARGGGLVESFAELMGRKDGCSEGKGGSMHFYKKDNGMGTAEWRAAKSPAYYKRGDYVPGLKVDGMDALAVKQACKFAKDHVLTKGPIILEMDTYRYHGHSMSDPGSTYRMRDKISGVRGERDPVERIRNLILDHNIATEQELKDIEKGKRKVVDEAIAKAKESPMPDPSDLFTNVYVKGFGVEVFGADRKELRSTLP
ncbi:hypothetical protein R3W88_010579 [Solanum pinnatisectum]|uniref:Dehydrogenase E1 component domain-containing protein n=1 Tax=Solanum pinnatisectum TaxID=50273 RepID=A0AAV9L431_9SOLN|nr:hypothetical protein R3W88_010579 [Solanum pinnatisectum]